MFPIYAIIYFLICGIIGLILRLKKLEILKNKGYKVNYFFTGPINFFRFIDIISDEENPSIKRKYKMLVLGEIILIPIYFIGMFVIIGLTA